MGFTIRPLIYSDYDDILVGWWKAWKTTVPTRDYLPDNAKGGLIVYDEDTPVCAGFIYNTNSSIAWCEFIVTNFEYKDRKKREECLNILGAKITEAAKDAGKGYLMTLLRSELLKKVCKDQGYLSMKDGYTNMIKIL